MKKIGSIVSAVLLTLIIISCDKDDDYNINPDFRLTFSTDTLAFDTLLTGFGSTTKRLKVYNKSSSKAKLSRIFLYNDNSPYRLNVNGKHSIQFTDIEINANDSLFVFVEVALQPTGIDEAKKLEDILVCEINENLQGVILETYAQDVTVVDTDMVSSQDWSGNKPYLIENAISVAENVSLTIHEGVSVYFRKSASLKINGQLVVNGSFVKPVYFGSTRFEELYDNVPAQWDGLYFSESSLNNSLHHFTIEDGINGLNFLGDENQLNSLNLSYGTIRNFSQKGISINNVNALMHDLIVTNCGDECLNVEGQSKVEVYHTSFFNAWIYDVRVDDVVNLDIAEGGSGTIGNSIIWGSHSNELSIQSISNIKIENCVLRLSESLTTEYSSVLTDCLINENPLFNDYESNDFNLSADSPCINKGKIAIGLLYSIDKNELNRNGDIAPDIGAYEYLQANE